MMYKFLYKESPYLVVPTMIVQSEVQWAPVFCEPIWTARGQD